LGGWPGMIQASTVPGSLEAKMLKPPRIIRLDPSDTFVFERARDPGEWAVSRAFMFWHCNDQAAPGQKQRVALRSGFLGQGECSGGMKQDAADPSAFSLQNRLRGVYTQSK
jgi:hypothetical protein